MPLPGKRYTDWTSKDLDFLIDKGDPAHEGQRLDFKKECHLLREDGARDKARRDILVDNASMANASGGLLLFGVDQKRKPNSPPEASELTGIPKGEMESLKTAISSLVDSHLDVRPSPLRFKHVHIEGGDTVVLIIEVEPNTFSLSMVTYRYKKREMNQFWIRRGTDNRPMMTDEIQYRFGEMDKVREKASEALGSIRAEFMSRHVGVPYSWFVAVPYQRARDHIPVAIRRMQDIIIASKYFPDFKFRDFTDTWTPAGVASRLRPSLNGIGMGSNYTGRPHLEIGRDGTLTFRVVPVTDLTDGVPAVGLGMGLYGAWCSSLYLLRDIQQEFGISPVYIIQAGVMNVKDVGIVLKNCPVSSWTSPENEVTLDAITLSQDWDPKFEFRRWATQFANHIGEEDAIPESPWVT